MLYGKFRLMVLPELDDLSYCRKRFFIYRMTARQGYTTWFHLSVDFSIVSAHDKVISEYKLQDWQGAPHTIRAEGKLIDGRFICFLRDFSSEERCCVYLFPNFRTSHNKPCCGICLHQTWDKDAPDCLSRAIIHDAPVADWLKPGLLDDMTGKSLDDLWEAEFLVTHLTLVRSRHKIT